MGEFETAREWRPGVVEPPEQVECPDNDRQRRDQHGQSVQEPATGALANGGADPAEQEEKQQQDAQPDDELGQVEPGEAAQSAEDGAEKAEEAVGVEHLDRAGSEVAGGRQQQACRQNQRPPERSQLVVLPSSFLPE
jgi:hypothetical protein